MPVTSDKTVTDVVTDFLASGAALAEIADYRLPEDFQTRAHELLNKNRSGNLNDEERAEMEEFREIDHILTLVKAKSRLKLKSQT